MMKVCCFSGTRAVRDEMDFMRREAHGSNTDARGRDFNSSPLDLEVSGYLDYIEKYENSEIKFSRLRELIKGKLKELIEREHVTHFISGMMLGSDTFTAEIVLELKKTYPITLECVLPCAEQSDYWKLEDRERYLSIVRQAEYETTLQESFSPECYKLFADYLVKKSDFFMAIWSGMRGYALDTICSAYDKGKCVFIINPKLL